MNEPTLLFSALLSALCGGIYYYVGRVLIHKNSLSSDSRLAWHLFVVWWYALAGATLASALLSLLGALGITNLPLFVTLTLINLLATCVALFGLMYYLLYLFSGNRRWLTPVVIFYIVYYIFLLYYVEASVPASVSVEPWRVRLVYQQQLGGPWTMILLLLLLFPQIIGSLAYFTLYFRVKNPTQKYRIVLVSWSIVIWFLSAFLGNLVGLNQVAWWQIFTRLIGLAAALTILIAYQPPTSLKRRLGVASILEDVS
ncbi:MAG: hypothetical protein QM730_04925 [Anaerolineales bacterium]